MKEMLKAVNPVVEETRNNESAETSRDSGEPPTTAEEEQGNPQTGDNGTGKRDYYTSAKEDEGIYYIAERPCEAYLRSNKCNMGDKCLFLHQGAHGSDDYDIRTYDPERTWIAIDQRTILPRYHLFSKSDAR